MVQQRSNDKDVIVKVLGHIDKLQQQADEMWLRTMDMVDPGKLMAVVFVTFVFLPFGIFVFLFSIFFKAVALATLYAPSIIINCIILILTRVVVFMRNYRARNTSVIILFTVSFCILVVSCIPLVDSWFRLLYRHTSPDVNYGDDLLLRTEIAATEIDLQVEDSNFAVYTGVGTAGVLASSLSVIMDSYIMADIVCIVGTITVVINVMTITQVYSLRMDDTRPPFLNISHFDNPERSSNSVVRPFNLD